MLGQAVRLTAVIVILAGRPAHAESAADPESQAKRAVTVEVPPAGEVQEAVLKDGSRLYGRVVKVDGEGIHFQTVRAVSVVLAEAEIVALKRVRGRIVDDEFVPSSPKDGDLFAFPLVNFVWRF